VKAREWDPAPLFLDHDRRSEEKESNEQREDGEDELSGTRLGVVVVVVAKTVARFITVGATTVSLLGALAAVDAAVTLGLGVDHEDIEVGKGRVADGGVVGGDESAEGAGGLEGIVIPVLEELDDDVSVGTVEEDDRGSREGEDSGNVVGDLGGAGDRTKTDDPLVEEDDLGLEVVAAIKVGEGALVVDAASETPSSDRMVALSSHVALGLLRAGSVDERAVSVGGL